MPISDRDFQDLRTTLQQQQEDVTASLRNLGSNCDGVTPDHNDMARHWTSTNSQQLRLQYHESMTIAIAT
ncbi:hypothetical protein Lal_00021480 [Lupinus albus]|nr:hypothetical protein Lal_00021480 [Lupinus albus]